VFSDLKGLKTVLDQKRPKTGLNASLALSGKECL